MNALIDELNPPQREAVLTTEGPVLVLAGAGSGKTRALTHRIAYMVKEKGIRPWNILAITFTNKAAGEMKRRVEALTGTGDVFVSTFHSACVRILRSGADRLGYGCDFTIYDTDDAKTLLRHIIKEKNYDPRQYREKEILSRISSLKNEMVTADAYSRRSAGMFREEKIAELYLEYQRRLMAANAMDFDDLLVNTVALFRDNPDVLEKYQLRFRYILVDEYQDTNEAQFRIVEMLAHEHHNLCVVGDDDQSIYKFRGADVRNILNFEKAFPGAKVIRLEQNYRSFGNILKAANAVIANNTSRKEKKLWTEREDGEKLVLQRYESAPEEAVGIVRDIEREKARFPYGDCAVLYRTNSQSRLLEEKFVQAGIPYRLVGGTNFYQRKEVKDILCYLKTVMNGNDDVAVQRIINVPRRGIGDTTISRVAELAAAEGLTFFEALKQADRDPALKRAAAKLKGFTELIEELRIEKTRLRVWELIEQILLRTGYQEELQEEGALEAEARLENIRELENKAADLGDDPEDPEALSRFLEDVALVAEVDSLTEEDARVVLMTLHSAKGLEFRKVCISGMEEGVFPGQQSLFSGSSDDLEEERRLCYVGITRAREKLVLTAARSRMVNGSYQYHDLSRFIAEIPPELLQREGCGMYGAAEGAERQRQREWQNGFGGAYGFGGSADSFGSRSGGNGAYSSFGSGAYGFGSDETGACGFGDAPFGRSGARSSAAKGRGIGENSFSFGQPRRDGGGLGRVSSPAGWLDFGRSSGYGQNGFVQNGRREDREAPFAAAQAAEDVFGEPADPAALRPGDRVKHARYGEGTVVSVEESKRDYKVTLDFDSAGRKTMLASFAGLMKI